MLDEFAALADLNGRLLFVACEHPDFHVGFNQHVDRFGHAVLQLIFDRRGAHVTEVALQRVVQIRKLCIFLDKWDI